MPLDVRIVIAQTFLSSPVCTALTRARGHLVGDVGSSLKHAISSTRMFSVGLCHLDKRFKVVKYSFDHLSQKWLVSRWQRCHLRSIEIGWRDSGGSGKAVIGFPMRKCPGVNASIPSEGSGSGVRGLELRHAST